MVSTVAIGLASIDAGCLTGPTFGRRPAGGNSRHQVVIRLQDDRRFALLIRIKAVLLFEHPVSGSQNHQAPRNPQGIDFGPDGTLYESEHGPKTDDEINILKAGANYGAGKVEGVCKTGCEGLTDPVLAMPRGCVIGGVLSIILIGFLVLLFWAIWLIVRVVKGF